MKILSGKKYSQLSAAVQEVKSQNDQIKGLRAEVGELSSSIMTWREKAESFRGTKYNTYAEQVSIADAMFNGTADWGVNQLGALVQARVSFIIPRGFKIIPKNQGADKELKFAEQFADFNGLSKENIYHFASEGELEGKLLFKLFFDNTTEFTPEGEKKPIKGMTSIRYISQTSNPYSVKVKVDDYMAIESATYKQGDKPVTVLESALVYRKFGGRLDKINDTSSKVLKVLTQIENLDRALRDWREINRLFATPIPHVQTDTAEEASAMATALNKSNWKPGKMFAHTGTFDQSQPSMTGVDSLYREIVVLAEMISYNTGVPIHYWFPELATNRATAEDISFGLINSATSRERKIWEGMLEEMINKAIKIYNDKAKMTPLRQGMLKVEIPVLTKEDWERFTAVWLPLFNAKGITLRTLLSKLPDDLDVEKEIEEVQAEKEAAFERMKENGLFQAQLNQEDEENGGNKGNVGNFGNQDQKEKA